MLIPKIFHRVWLGSRKMPAEFERYWNHWRHLHPSWEFRTWTTPLVRLNNQPLYDVQINPGVRADILRVEILAAHGGVYVDTDMEPVKKIEPLIEHVSCFGGRQASGFGNAIMGCTPGHPAMRLLINRIGRAVVQPLPLPAVTHVTGPDMVQEAWQSRYDVTGFEMELLMVPPHGCSERTFSIHHQTRLWMRPESESCES